MSRIKAREAAINRATSLFDMKKLDERLLSLGADSYLTDGDERRDVVMAHDRAWKLFRKKCEQLAVGKYKITSKRGHSYIVEITDVIKDNVYPYTFYANIYKNNKLYSKGHWICSEAAIKIRHTLITDEKFIDGRDEDLTIYPDLNTYTLKWYGKIEKDENGWWGWQDDKGMAEKIR